MANGVRVNENILYAKFSLPNLYDKVRPCEQKICHKICNRKLAMEINTESFAHTQISSSLNKVYQT